LLDAGADRSSFVVGIGGGVVCDITGFVASTYMRGVEFGFVATSLLAQVDASVGGKNGVDLDGFKNIVGTFNQPRFVICDTSMLKTLPAVELSNGFAEMIKHTLIADAVDFRFMEENIERLMGCDVEVITPLLAKSVRIKANIVTADEHEKGERKKLNLGHTWGHAVEKISGLPHGQSVSIGLEFAARLSTEKGLLENRDYMRLMNLLRELHLPICTNINPLRIFDALTKDKKRIADSVDFILMKGIGEVVIERIDFVDIQNFIKR
jgi:3-dehydroquinate synthase